MTEFRTHNKATWQTSKWIFRTLESVWLDVRIDGLDRVPERGPFVLVSNHSSALDPLLVAFHSPRYVRFVAKPELFQGAVGWWMRGMNSIEADTGFALAGAVRTLRSGVGVCIFPEGTRSPDGHLLPGLDGAARMALMTGASIVPMGISGTNAVMPPGARRIKRGRRVDMRVGDAFTLDNAPARRPSAQQVEAATFAIMRAIGELLPSSHQPRDTRQVYGRA